MEAIKKRTINIEGMKCSGCEKIIEEELMKVKGIRIAKADHEKKKLSLEYNLLNITMQDIHQKIKKLGYALPETSIVKAERNILYRTEQMERNTYLGIKDPLCSGCANAGCYVKTGQD